MQAKNLLFILGGLAASYAYAADGDLKPEIFQLYQGEDLLTINALSNNGQWALTQTAGDQDTDNPLPAGGSLIDMSTLQLTTITTESGWASITDVTDGGTVVGSEGGVPAFWTPTTGEWTYLPITHQGCDTGNLLGVTPDGKYACGYVGSSEDMYLAEPVLYDLTTLTEIPLSNLPTRGMSGVEYRQCAAYNLSPDGKYLLCDYATSYLKDEAGYPLFAFVYDVDAQDWEPVGFELDKASWTWTPRYEGILHIWNQYLSPDGRYVTGTFYMSPGGSEVEGGTEYKTPFVYDRVADELTVYDDENDHDFGGDQVTPEGTAIAHAASDNPYPTAYARYGKYFISFNEILSQVYGMDLALYNGDGVSGSCQAMSEDGRTLVMVSYDNCYVLKMAESFADAASRVDLMANYSLSIPSGTMMTNLTDIDVIFDRSIVMKGDPATIQVFDEDNNAWATALSSTAVANDNDKKLHISFRHKQMEADKTYKVVIPAGFLNLKDDATIANHEITFTYKGRADVPVTPLTITPANNTGIAELSSSQMIELTFASSIKVDDNFSAALYVSGQESPIANMAAAYDGKKAYFYPATTQYLYEGSDYQVVIAAGSITDLSGAGGNEEIILNYTGAYVRTVSSDDKYIFFEDFSHLTNTWASNFMYWMTTWNEPTAQMQNWGFTINTPWTNVMDDDGLDQAIATHSMFEPAGTADTWMMTPWLYIPDEKCILSFDAQSYLNNKEDVLRVYIYATDKVYNNITADMVDELAADIRENGDLIIETVLSPGENEEVLAGDWQHFVYDLKDYAQQNIYVLFNNNNTDQSAIFIDNVMVMRNFAFLTSLTTPESVVDQESVVVKGVLTVESEIDTFQSATLILLDGDGVEVDRIEEEGLSLSKGDRYPFEFAKELPLEYGVINKYTLDLSLDQEQSILELSVKNLAFEPERIMVLEEISGSTCSNCPLGFLAAEYISTLYPNNFYPIILRAYGGDRHSTGLWADIMTYCDNVLQTSSAPMGKIDRGELSSPMMTNESTYVYTGEGLTDSTGAPIMLWADYAVEEMNTPAEGDINFSVAYNEETGLLTVPCTVRYALTSNGKNIGLFAVVVEDGVQVFQSNGFAQIEDANLGEWGKGGTYGRSNVIFNINHLARQPFTTAASGIYMENNDFTAGEEYSQTLTYTLAEGVITDPNNCQVIVMMIDGITGKVINANSCAFNSSTGSIGSIESDIQSAISVVADNGAINVASNLDAEVTVFGTSGVTLAKGHAAAGDMLRLNVCGYRGVAIVAVATEAGVTVRKLIIR